MAGPLLAARALLLRCAASAVLSQWHPQPDVPQVLLVRELLAELGSTPLGVLRPLRQQCVPRLQRPLER